MPASSLTAYRLTPAAQNDLEDIWLYTAQQWSMAQAGRYMDFWKIPSIGCSSCRRWRVSVLSSIRLSAATRALSI